VNVTLAARAQADATYSSNRTAYDATDLTGIGDKAFVANDGGIIGAEKGSTTVLIHVVGFEKDQPAQLQAKQKALLQVCLTHVS
jgi:hypothetical protein